METISLTAEVRSHSDLRVYQQAFDLAMQVFEITKPFPDRENDSLTAPFRLAPRLVCSLIAEAWQKRRNRTAFVAALCEAEAKVVSTQGWIHFAVSCKYLDPTEGRRLYREFHALLSRLQRMAKANRMG